MIFCLTGNKIGNKFQNLDILSLKKDRKSMILKYPWIKTLGTAIPYGCNDNIYNVKNVTSPPGNNMNVIGIFLYAQRCTRCHIIFTTRQHTIGSTSYSHKNLLFSVESFELVI